MISTSIPLLVIILTVVVLWAMVSSANRRRRAQEGPRPCIECGMLHPGHASYCRHCGKKLP